jgi:flagellar FliJ protein
MAKKFRFSLENILKYRKNMQDDKRVRLHNKKVVLESEQSKLQQIKNLKVETLNDGREADVSQLNILEKKIYHDYLQQINQHLDIQDQVVVNSRSAVMAATEELNDETRRKKILEKLKEQHLEGFRKDLRRQEEKDNSEIALRNNYFKND